MKWGEGGRELLAEVNNMATLCLFTVGESWGMLPLEIFCSFKCYEVHSEAIQSFLRSSLVPRPVQKIRQKGLVSTVHLSLHKWICSGIPVYTYSPSPCNINEPKTISVTE